LWKWNAPLLEGTKYLEHALIGELKCLWALCMAQGARFSYDPIHILFLQCMQADHGSVLMGVSCKDSTQSGETVRIDLPVPRVSMHASFKTMLRIT